MCPDDDDDGNVGENGNSSVGRKRSAEERKKDGRQESADFAGKENIRSPFIFINKTSRRVRSARERGRRALGRPHEKGKMGEEEEPGTETRQMRWKATDGPPVPGGAVCDYF